MDYVGKPLAYIPATPEQPDDADNPRGSRSATRPATATSRSSPAASTARSWTASAHRARRSSSPVPPALRAASIGQGVGAVAIYDSETVSECAGRRVRRARRAAQPRRGDRRAGQHRGRRLLPGLLQRPRRERRADAARHVLVRRPGLPRRRRLRSTWPAAPPTGCAWTARTSPRPIERILQRLPAVALVAVYAVPDPNVETRSWPRSCSRTTPAHARRTTSSSPRSGPPVEGLAALRPDRPHAADDRHQQGAQARPHRPGRDRRRRGAVGAGRARDGVLGPRSSDTAPARSRRLTQLSSSPRTQN